MSERGPAPFRAPGAPDTDMPGVVASDSGDPVEPLAQRLAALRRSGVRETDRDFALVLTLLRPRIRRLIRQYGLEDLREDAEQAAALGIHRALGSFDPAKARFVTHATWQMRGELQSLRHRTRLDHRRSARNAGARTVSLEALRGAGAGAGAYEIVDEGAWSRAEAGASDAMARAWIERMMGQIGAPEHERAIVVEHVFEDERDAQTGSGLTAEQRRQVVRRTLGNGARAASVHLPSR